MKKGHSPFIRSILLSLLGFSLFISLNASAIDATEVQLDKLSLQQLEQAAQAGDPDAQYALGYMYYYGNGVPRNAEKAVNWIKRASVQGQEQATKALVLIQSSAPAAQTATKAKPVTAASNAKAGKPVNAKPQKTTPPPASKTQAKKSTAKPTKTAATAQSKPVATATSSSGVFTSEEQHLMGLPGDYYTVQVLGSYSIKDVEKYINKHSLQGKVAFYRGDNKGKDWYVVLYGLYKTSGEAKTAISELPEGVRKNKPWVKKLSSVQEGIRKKAPQA